MSNESRPLKCVHKFKAEERPTFTVAMDPNAKILSVAQQFGKIQMWALVDPDAKHATRYFVWVETGRPFDEHGAHYITTMQLDGGAFVLHLFEIEPDVAKQHEQRTRERAAESGDLFVVVKPEGSEGDVA